MRRYLYFMLYTCALNLDRFTLLLFISGDDRFLHVKFSKKLQFLLIVYLELNLTLFGVSALIR